MTGETKEITAPAAAGENATQKFAEIAMSVILSIILGMGIVAWPFVMMFSGFEYDAPLNGVLDSFLRASLVLLLFAFGPIALFCLLRGAILLKRGLRPIRLLAIPFAIPLAVAILMYVSEPLQSACQSLQRWPVFCGIGDEHKNIGGIHTLSYRIYGNAVYYINALASPSYAVPLEGADAASFQIFSEDSGYAKDKDHAYYSESTGLIVIDGADVPSFEASTSSLLYYYARDKDHAYYRGSPVAYADVDSFEPLLDDFAKDAHHVYFKAEIITDMDPKTFTLIKNKVGYWTPYSKDKARVYYDGDSDIYNLQDADPNSFTLIFDERGVQTDYAKDSTHVYYHEHIMPSADAKTFHLSQYGQWKDANHTYNEGVPVQ